MVALDIVVDGTREGSGPPFDLNTIVQTKEPIKVIGMPQGTRDGNASVLFRFTLPDGREVFAETTLRLFGVAADVLRAAHPEALHGPGPASTKARE